MYFIDLYLVQANLRIKIYLFKAVSYFLFRTGITLKYYRQYVEVHTACKK